VIGYRSCMYKTCLSQPNVGEIVRAEGKKES
jgi:hypothetical protein